MARYQCALGSSGALAAALGLFLTSGAVAHAQTLYNTQRVLDQAGNACLRAAKCVSIEAKTVAVDAGKDASVSLQCPARHPYLLGWDSRHHEHITVTAAPRLTASDQASKAVTFVIGNVADASGSATLYLGCSDVEVHPTAAMEQTSALPSHRFGVRSWP